MRPEAFLAASAFSRNECDDEAKPKAASGDDTNRLTKPACVQISTFLHARRHRGAQSRYLSAYLNAVHLAAHFHDRASKLMP